MVDSWMLSMVGLSMRLCMMGTMRLSVVSTMRGVGMVLAMLTMVGVMMIVTISHDQCHHH